MVPTDEITLKSLNRVVGVYDLKKMFTEKKVNEFDPAVVHRKESFKIEQVVTVHRYVTSKLNCLKKYILS